MNNLKIYMGYDRVAGSNQGACLIFAHNAKEARKIGYPILRDWFEDTVWIDMAARRLEEYCLYAEADQQKLLNGIAHVIETPRGCPRCEFWGGGVPDENGRCDFCCEKESHD